MILEEPASWIAVRFTESLFVAPTIKYWLPLGRILSCGIIKNLNRGVVHLKLTNGYSQSGNGYGYLGRTRHDSVGDDSVFFDRANSCGR